MKPRQIDLSMAHSGPLPTALPTARKAPICDVKRWRGRGTQRASASGTMQRFDNVLLALIGIHGALRRRLHLLQRYPIVSSATRGPATPAPKPGAAARTADASPVTYGQCSWPSSLYDGGPGSCTVGRAYVACSYPVGVTCEGGVGASGLNGGIDMGCISDDPTSCAGCTSVSGTATCQDMCGPDKYAIGCGGPPHFVEDGAPPFTYQEPPDACAFLAVTPAGSTYSCCPCQ